MIQIQILTGLHTDNGKKPTTAPEVPTAITGSETKCFRQWVDIQDTAIT